MVHLGLILAVNLLARDFGPNFFLFAVSYSYLAYLVAGQVLYYIWAGRVRLGEAAVLLLLVFAVVVHCTRSIYPQFLRAESSYMISFVYAFAVFAGLMIAGPRLRPPMVLDFFAEISYSL